MRPTAAGPSDASVLARSFERADQRYGPVPSWWWSGGRLERVRLRWPLEQLCAQGLTQAVVMGLAACADAHRLGLHFWLYDQFGFCEANFQGQLTAAHPEWTGRELVRTKAGTGPSWPLWTGRYVVAPFAPLTPNLGM